MIAHDDDRPYRRTRRVMRSAVIVFLLAALLLIAAEWTVSDLAGGSGRLITAGLVLCLCANLLCVFLMIGRRSERED